MPAVPSGRRVREERFVSKEIQSNYEQSAGFTNQYLKDLLPKKVAAERATP